MTVPGYDLEVKPHLTPYFAYGAAFLIAAAHIAVGFLLKIGSSGVIFQTADQVAIGVLGVIIGCLVLMFARPRLRVGPDGLPLEGRAVGQHQEGVPDRHRVAPVVRSACMVEIPVGIDAATIFGREPGIVATHLDLPQFIRRAARSAAILPERQSRLAMGALAFADVGISIAAPAL